MKPKYKMQNRSIETEQQKLTLFKRGKVIDNKKNTYSLNIKKNFFYLYLCKENVHSSTLTCSSHIHLYLEYWSWLSSGIYFLKKMDILFELYLKERHSLGVISLRKL